MKNKLINNMSNRLAKPGIITAIAVAGGFWLTQYLGWEFVATVAGTLPKITGVLSFTALLLFFIVRVADLRFRLPAILGLCSSSVLLALFAFLSYYTASVQDIEAFMLLSLGLAFAGVALDANRCWRLVAQAGVSRQTMDRAIAG